MAMKKVIDRSEIDALNKQAITLQEKIDKMELDTIQPLDGYAFKRDPESNATQVEYFCADLRVRVIVLCEVGDKAQVCEHIADVLNANEDVILAASCTKPPTGWRCTREPNHDGPCAAHNTQTRTMSTNPV